MSFFRHNRLPLIVFALCAGVGSGLMRPSLVANDEAELRSALSVATGQIVEQLVWEPSEGILNDVVRGRRLLFLASTGPQAPRDVYRARVRVSYEGKPLQLCDYVNLTNTPLSDEHNLVVVGERAAFSSFSEGAEQAVTVLDLRGEGEQNLAERRTDRWMAAITNLQNTGSSEGIGRIDLAFAEPAQSVSLQLHERKLTVTVARAQSQEHLEVDLEQPELVPESVNVTVARHLPKRPVFWAVDTVRAVPWIGPAPIAWLEERTFALRDQARQLVHSGDEATMADASALEAEVLPPAVFDDKQPLWPPADIASPWSNPEEGEGKWLPIKQDWLAKLPSQGGEESPSPFLNAFVRPDEKRPYVRVLLVAMDMRQLELGMEAGLEDPKPLSGPPGPGRLPRDPVIFKRAIAAFNGGFKTEHGSYGMMVQKRMMLPAIPGGATVATLQSGEVVMGTWGQEAKTGGPPPPAELVSFRQNMDPLLEDGVVNPTKRHLWGFTLPGTSMQTERSGVCMTPQGQLIYAWGDDLSADTLGKAMRLAGCSYGIHLDMNPHHTGFTFMNIDELKGKKFKSELLTPKMGISPERYISYAPKDFFYLLLRNPNPPPIVLHDDQEPIAWSAMPSTVQPPPKFLPALHTAQLQEGGESVELMSIAKGRFDLRLRASQSETESSAQRELGAEEASRVTIAFGLGSGGAGGEARRGLRVGGKSLGESIGGGQSAWLVVPTSGGPRLEAAPPSEGDGIELSRLALDGAALPQTKPTALALSILDDGRLLLARATRPSPLLVRALLAAGARDVFGVVGVNRATTYQAGTEHALRTHYTETTLSLLAAPMVPTVKRFTPTQAYVKPAPPKKK